MADKSAADGVSRGAGTTDLAPSGLDDDAAVLRAIFESLPVGVALVGRDGTVLHANSANARMWGIPALPRLGGFADYSVFKGWHPETGRPVAPDEWPAAEASITGRAVLGRVFDIERFDGTRGSVEVSAIPLPAEVGSRPLIVVLTLDVTEQRHAQEERDTERRRLETILRALPVGIFIVDAEGALIDGNEYSSDIWGKGHPRPRRIQDYSVFKGWWPETGEPLRPEDWPVARTLRTGLSYLAEVIDHERFDGTRGTMLASSAPIRGENGELIGAITTMQDVTEQRDRARFVRDVNHLLAEVLGELGFDYRLRLFLERAAQSLGADGGVAFRIGPERAVLTAVYNLPDDDIGFQLPTNALALSAQALSSGGPIVFPHARDNPVQRLLAHGREPFESAVVIPMRARGEPIGSLILLFSAEKAGLSRAEQDFAESLMLTAPLALFNSELFEQRQRQQGLSTALNEIDTAIASTLDFDQIVERVVERAAEAIGADSAVMYVREDEDWVVRATTGLPPGFIGRRFAAEEIRYSVEAMERPGNVAIFNDLSAEDARNEVVRVHGVRRAIDLALRLGDRLVGDFALHYHSEEKAFTEEHADFLRKLGVSVTLALQNSRLYEQERDIADTLQRSLLATPNNVSGIEFDCLYRSASQTASVGGDFYDVFEMDDDRVGLMIGDVSGKGLQASTLTSLVRNTLQAYVYDTDSPAAAIAKANAVIVRNVPSDIFVTLLFGILDTRSGAFVYCNAGHPSGILLRHDAPPSLLPANGPLVGAFGDFGWEDASATLHPADMLFLYTDGVIEARRGGDLYGEERLVEAVGRLGQGGSPMGLPKGVIAEVTDFAGGSTSDDIAMLAVRLRPA